MYASTVALPSAFLSPTAPYSRLPTPSVWPPLKSRRMERAETRRTVTRRAGRSFDRFYGRLLARRSKVLFTRSLTNLRRVA